MKTLITQKRCENDDLNDTNEAFKIAECEIYPYEVNLTDHAARELNIEGVGPEEFADEYIDEYRE